MLTQKNLPCLAPFPSMTHRVDVSLQPKILRPPITPSNYPIRPSLTLPSYPDRLRSLNRQYSSPNPLIPLPSELTLHSTKTSPPKIIPLTPKTQTPGFGTGPRTQAKNSLRLHKTHRVMNLEVRSTKLSAQTRTHPHLLLQHPAPPQTHNNNNLPTKLRYPSRSWIRVPTLVKKRFKIGNKKQQIYTHKQSNS